MKYIVVFADIASSLPVHPRRFGTDPKGDIVVSCGHALQKNGYQIKILNSLNFKKSMHYNPFALSLIHI